MKAIINDREYRIDPDLQPDLIQTAPNEYHLIIGQSSYRCRLVDQQFNNKQFVVDINGREHTVQLKDATDELVERLGLAVVANQASNDIFAPMPGLVLDIMVEAGQEIETGTPLLILEAMKMENVLKAEGDGVVKAIEVKKGEAVEKRQLLIEIE